MLKSLYCKMNGRLSHYYFALFKKIKINSDYNYLLKRGVETEKGFVILIGKPIIRKEKGSTIKIGKGVVLVSDSVSKKNLAGINHPVILATYSSDSEIIIEDCVGM